FYYRLNTFFGLVSPFAELEYKPYPSLVLVPGLRFDYYPELDYKGSIVPEFWNYKSDIYRRGISGEPSFRFLTKYNINEKQLVKAAIGTYNQTPQPQGFVTDKEFGNPELPATNARHLVLGYEHRFSDLISADIQIYHNQQWKIPVFTTSSELLSDPSTKRIIPEGKGRMYGLEILLRHDNNGRFFGWIAYTLSRSERFNRSENRYTLYDRDQTHNLQLVVSSRVFDQLEAGCRIRYVTGNPQTPIIGSVYDATNRFYRPEYGAENSMRNDPFFQVDIRIDKRFIFNNWILSAYIDLQNVLLFIYKSPEFTVYNYDYTEKTIVSLPFIPSFGIRAEF
ncbi:MAG: TonB-dependent receptor, partial [Chitinispirillaceae bacterium]|nr:TonB-dependent receptor [Chitinispirillaceae bacterium]